MIQSKTVNVGMLPVNALSLMSRAIFLPCFYEMYKFLMKMPGFFVRNRTLNNVTYLVAVFFASTIVIDT